MKNARLFIVLIILAGMQASGCYTSKKPGVRFSSQDKYNNIAIAVAPYSTEPLPAKIDFSECLPPVGNQIPQNSCVAWALGYGCRSYYAALNSNTGFVTDKKTINYSGIISPAFIYNLINNNQNNGASLYDALKLLADVGACSFQSMPYQRYNWHKKPTPSQIIEARKFSISTFRRVDLNYAVVNLKAQLAIGTPVVIATVYDKKYYNYGHNTKDSVYLWDKLANDNDSLGHSVLLVGYDDSLQAFKFMNSWGVNWGNQGFGWISYNLAPLVIREAYIIKPANFKAPEKIKIGESDTIKGLGGIDTNLTKILRPTSNVITDKDKNESGLNIYIDTIVTGLDNVSDEYPNGQMGLTATGAVALPPNLGHNFQIVIHFYHNNNGEKGAPVFSLDDKSRLANQFAEVGTEVFYVPADSTVNTNWKASIPFSSLDIPEGVQTSTGYLPAEIELIAEPVLFIDKFPIRTGKLVPITFNR